MELNDCLKKHPMVIFQTGKFAEKIFRIKSGDDL
jgi:hypothetical protein